MTETGSGLPRTGALRPPTPVTLTASVAQRWPDLVATLTKAGLRPVVRPRASLGADDVVLVHPAEASARLGDATAARRVFWVVDREDVDAHVSALRAGAHGVLPADTDAEHLRLVVRAALRDHVVVPAAAAQALVADPR